MPTNRHFTVYDVLVTERIRWKGRKSNITIVLNIVKF